MNPDYLQGTGYDKRAPSDSVKTGVVIDVNIEEGTCRVRTQAGEALDRVRPMGMGGGSGGTGMFGLPTPRTRCIVLKTGEVFSDNILLGTFPELDPSDGKTPIGPAKELLPGMVAHHFDDGGRFLLAPSGMVDIKAHPWAHRTYVPSEHLIREHVRQFEQKSGPHDLIRRISSTEEENSFMELMLNDRFLYREEDEDPPIIWTLGDNTRGDTSPFNPESQFRHFYQVEHRSRSSSDPMGRYTQEVGLVDGHVSRETFQVMGSEVKIEDKTGHFEGGDGKSVFQKTATKEGDLLTDVEVRDDGHVYVETPAWKINIGPDGKAVIENEDTEIKIDGEEITIGGGSSEQIVLGNTMLSLMNDLIKWLMSHTHPTPVGPSGPPIEAPNLASIQSQYKLPAGSKSDILSKINFVSE